MFVSTSISQHGVLPFVRAVAAVVLVAMFFCTASTTPLFPFGAAADDSVEEEKGKSSTFPETVGDPRIEVSNTLPVDPTTTIMTLSPTGYHIFLEHRYPHYQQQHRRHNNNNNRDTTAPSRRRVSDDFDGGDDHSEDEVHYVPQAICHGNHCKRDHFPHSIRCYPVLQLPQLNRTATSSTGHSYHDADQEDRQHRLPTAVTLRGGIVILRRLWEHYHHHHTGGNKNKGVRDGEATNNVQQESSSLLVDSLGDSILTHYIKNNQVGGGEGGGNPDLEVFPSQHQAGHPGDSLRLIGHVLEDLSLGDARRHRGYLRKGRTINFHADYTPTSFHDEGRRRSEQGGDGRTNDRDKPMFLDKVPQPDNQFWRRPTVKAGTAKAGSAEVEDAEYNLDVVAKGSHHRPQRGKRKDDQGDEGKHFHKTSDMMVADDDDGKKKSATNNVAAAAATRSSIHYHIPRRVTTPISPSSFHYNEDESDENDDGADDVWMGGGGRRGVVEGWECSLEAPPTMEYHYEYEESHLICLGVERGAIVVEKNEANRQPSSSQSMSSSSSPSSLHSLFSILPSLGIFGGRGEEEESSPFSTTSATKKSSLQEKEEVDRVAGVVCTLHYKIVNHGSAAPKIAFGVLLATTLAFALSMFCTMFPKDPQEEAAAKKRKEMKRMLKQQRENGEGGGGAGNGNKSNSQLRGRNVGITSPAADARKLKEVIERQRRERGDYSTSMDDEGFSVDEAMLRRLGIESRDANGARNYRPASKEDMHQHLPNNNYQSLSSSSLDPFAVTHRFGAASSSFNASSGGGGGGGGGMSTVYDNPRGLSLGELMGGGGGGSRIMGRRVDNRVQPPDLDSTLLLNYPHPNFYPLSSSTSSTLPTTISPGSINTVNNGNTLEAGMSSSSSFLQYQRQQHLALPIPLTPERSQRGGEGGGAAAPPSGDTYPIDGW